MDIKRVDRTGKTSAAGGAKKTGGTAGKGAFAQLLDVDDAAPAGAVGAISAVNALEALLAVQESGDALDSKKRARQHGEQLLDNLDEIRLSILSGAIPVAQLENLSRMAQSRRETVDDPALKSILDEIDLRAQVELAKYQRP